jgi:hypothetical protein
MNSDIRIGEIGRIKRGDELGKYVKILDDSQSTGGYLILTSSNADFISGFDNWVENFDILKKYFEESGWEVEWMK